MNDVEMSNISVSNDGCSVRVQNAYKRFSPTNVILNGLNMNVPVGCIYGLLGPSGCGKTTLLNSIVGKSQLDSGIISLKVDKLRDIGYMPQTLSLHTQMTIKENISFYGYLFGMLYDDIKNRTNEYINFLELPDKNRFVNELRRVSPPIPGAEPITFVSTCRLEGQKRRVSLIITLIHDPEILILDEPTVGMDLIISDRIWKRLLQMAAKGKSIIITTHYIQEAQQSHKIGLMREGVLLAEESPRELMEKCGCDDLETVFLRLSTRQRTTNTMNFLNYPKDGEVVSQYFKDDQMFSMQKVRGIFYKDITLLKRGYTFLIFALLLSTIILVVFNFIIGKPPKNLKIGVINEESSIDACDLIDIQSCFMNQSTNILFSCVLTDILRNKTYKIVEYEEEALAIRDFKKNNIYAVLRFPRNYTRALTRRFSKFMDNLDPAIVEQSLLDLWIDTSSKQNNKYLEIFITVDVAYGMLAFIKRVLTNCHWNPRIVTPPIFFERPIYGSMEETFTSYTLIPFLFVNSFVWPMVSIAVFFMAEKTSGIMDRLLLTGTSIIDTMSSFFVIQLVLQFFSTLITLVVIFGLFDFSMNGSMFLFTLLLMLISISGMLFGLLAGMVHADVRALGITLGCLNTVLLFFTGIARPLEEQHIILRSLGRAFPITWSIKGLQAIRFRDKHILESPVLEAFAFNVAFVAIFSVLILYLIKRKKIGCIQCMASVDGQPLTVSLL